jgi:predicted permease
MRWIRSAALRLRSLFRSHALDREMNEELRFHIERQIEQNLARGMPRKEARYAALREFGGVAQAQEECRDAWGIRGLNELAQDVRYGLRVMRHNAGLTTVIVLTLALGIGANTAIFSLIDAVLLKSLPVESPDQLFAVLIQSESGPSPSFSYPLLQDLRQGVSELADVIAVGSVDSRWEVAFSSPGGAQVSEQVFGEMVSGTFFPALGVDAVLGRVLNEQDDTVGSPPVAVISHRFWTRRFGNNRDVLGRSFTVSETDFTIVGVAAPEFFGVRPGTAPDVWAATAMQPQLSRGRSVLESYTNNWLRVLGRPKQGVSRRQVAAAMNVRFRQVLEARAAEQPEKSRERFLSQSIQLEDGRGGIDSLRRQYSEPLRILMVVAGLVLLIACANVANLLLARATARRREIAIRLAIGAARRRLIRQWMTESLLLATCGGLAGAALSFLAVDALIALVSTSSTPIVLDVAPDARLVAFAVAVTTFAALLFGMAPAIHGTHADVRGALGAVAPGLIVGHHTGAARRLLAVAQIALSLVLLIGAGLSLRTIYNLKTAESGFNRERLVTGFSSAHDAGYAIPFGGNVAEEEKRLAEGRARAMHARLLEELTTVPGVRSAALSQCGWIYGCNATNCCIEVQGRTRGPGDRGNIRVETISPSYVETTGMTLLAGRDFTDRDGPGAAPVAIVNETLARKYFGAPNPIGRYFNWDHDAKPIEIVGVLRDANHDGPRREAAIPFIYYPLAQRPSPFLSLVVRTSAAPAAMIPRIQEAVKRADSRLTVNLATVEQLLDDQIARERLLARLTTLFGLLALLVTCVGLYGLTAYSVARRTSEMGLRMALGAQRSTILWSVLRETLSMAAIGLALGMAVTLATMHLVESLLFGIAPADPLTIVLAAGVMAAVAAVAAFVPASRAANIHPIQALRYE